MEIINETAFQVATMLYEDAEGRPALGIIVKGTFAIEPGKAASLADEQIPIADTDQFYEDEEIESIKFESDLVPLKPRADVVLIGKAYAPGGRPATRVEVSLQVGSVAKKLVVFGNRFWVFPSRLAVAPTMTEPMPFETMDIVYDRAFGGIDHEGGEWCRENLVGKGFFAKKKVVSIDDAPLPNIEDGDDPDNLIRSWKSRPRPVGFGFYGKQWLPRVDFIGTVDEQWEKERAPNMPKDFRPDFYNGAHPELQLEGYLRGYESVELKNLTPQGTVRFYLSGLEPTVTVAKFDRRHRFLIEAIRGEPTEDEEREESEDENESPPPPPDPSLLPKIDEPVRLNLDTVCIIPDENRLYLVWRGLCPVHDLELIAAEIAAINIGIRKIEGRPEALGVPQRRPHRRATVEIGLLESTQSFAVRSEDRRDEVEETAVGAEYEPIDAAEDDEASREPEAIDSTGDGSPVGAWTEEEEGDDEDDDREVDRSRSFELIGTETEAEEDEDGESRVIDIGLIEATQGFSIADVEAAAAAVDFDSDSDLDWEDEEEQRVPEESSSGEWASEIKEAVDTQGFYVESKEIEGRRPEIVEKTPPRPVSPAPARPGARQEEREIVETADAVDSTPSMSPEAERTCEEATVEEPIEPTPPAPRLATPPAAPAPAPAQALAPRKLSLDKAAKAVAALYVKRLGILTLSVEKWEASAAVEKQLIELGRADRKIGKNALSKLIKLLDGDDRALVFAAAFSLLNLSAAQSFKILVRAAAAAPVEKRRSLVDAVRFANLDRTELASLVVEHLRISDPSVQMFLLEIIADRRLSGDRIQSFIGKCLFGTNRDVVVAALKAQGKLRFPEFLTLIRRLALSPDIGIQDAALLDLLLDGKYEAFRVLRRLCNQTTKGGARRYVYLSFNGGKPDVPLLMKHSNEPLALWGIGFLGYADAVPILIKLLNSNFSAVCLAAAEALQIITGAVFENQDEKDPQKRFISRCASIEQWERWWRSFGAKFSHDVRWRKGKVFNPGRCIQQMSDSSLSFLERRWAYQELVIRTGEDVPFEPDWLVHEQRAALIEWERRWKARGKKLNE